MEASPLAVLEEAYKLELPLDVWQEVVTARLAELFPGHEGRFGFAYTVDESGVLLATGQHSSPDGVDDLRIGQSIARLMAQDPRLVSMMFNSIQCTTLSSRLAELNEPELTQHFAESGVIDTAAVCAGNATGGGFFFGAFLAERTDLGSAFTRRWMSVASHLAAIRRLHTKLEDRTVFDAADMIFDPLTGRVEDGRVGSSVLTKLRAAARNLDFVRSTRATEDERLARWGALVAGKWSLVDAFDADDRRFIVALPNADEARLPMRLSPRQSQIVQLLIQGHSQTFIAYELGLSQSTVAYHIARVRQLYRVENDAMLVDRIRRMLDGEVNTWVAGDLELLVVADARAVPELPPALAEVLELVRHGISDQAIADTRGVSVKTVRNQLSDLYRRFDVHSRAELVAALVGR